MSPETNSIEKSHTDNNGTAFDYSSLKEIEVAISKKYPNKSRDEIKKSINDLTIIVKSYMICRANLKATVEGSPAEKKFKKLFRGIKEGFELVQHALLDLNIHMDDDGNINGKWIWGKIIDEK